MKAAFKNFLLAILYSVIVTIFIHFSICSSGLLRDVNIFLSVWYMALTIDAYLKYSRKAEKYDES